MSTITFNSYSLQTTSIITEKITHASTPDLDLTTEQVARMDRSIITSDYWIKKTIQITGHLFCSSIAALDAKIDEIKAGLLGTNQNLDISFSGGTRRYLATTKSIEIEREHYNSSWCPFTIEFLCADPFGRATSTTSHTLTAQAASPFSLVFTMVGSVPAYPTISLTLTSGINVTQVKIENTTTSDSITLVDSYNNGDVILIDCDSQTAKINAVEYDFSGIFPEFVIGSNTVQVTITGSPFLADLAVTYTKLYL